MNYKRNKPRRKVRCAMCTPHRLGNSKKDHPIQRKRADAAPE